MGAGLLDAIADGLEVAGGEFFGLRLEQRMARVRGPVRLVDDLGEGIFQAKVGGILGWKSRLSDVSTSNCWRISALMRLASAGSIP